MPCVAAKDRGSRIRRNLALPAKRPKSGDFGYGRFWLLLLSIGLIGMTASAAAADAPSVEGDHDALRQEVACLIGELDSDRFEVRRRAADRLEELVARPELGRILSAEFQRVLVRPDVSFEVRWHLERWHRRLPEVPPEAAEQISPEQIDRIMQQLEDDSYGVRLGALRRLRWLLFQDEQLPRVKQALESRLAEGVDTETSVQLRKLLEMTRPAMVAEYWRARRHEGEQHLLVGVPSRGMGAMRPSHFDRIDDKVAHCVSGNNLAPGDYPVGVAFPHPHQPSAFFHLVNLPTPRRRLEYKIQVQTDQRDRLAAISRRTFDRVLAEKRLLSQRELIMLEQLDPEELSRFAGQYFHAVEDGPLPPPPVMTFPHTRNGGRPSRFGMLCALLATEGTKSAAPGLLKALGEGRFLPPTSLAPYELHWLAALSIAGRDPWPEVDAWLAGQVDQRGALVAGRPSDPELGATAAGLLLKRYGQGHSEFGLKAMPEALLMRWGIDGFRFTSAEARQKVQQWWQQELEKQKKP